jgi:hypothetical protein
VAPSRSAFSYAVVRIVPDIEREEFINAGLVMFDRERRYLVARTSLDATALEAMRDGCDVEAIRGQLRNVEAIAAGTLQVAPFATMSQSERFGWLTTPRSTIVQPGPLHAGTTEDPDATFEHLYRVLVARRDAGASE